MTQDSKTNVILGKLSLEDLSGSERVILHNHLKSKFGWNDGDEYPDDVEQILTNLMNNKDPAGLLKIQPAKKADKTANPLDLALPELPDLPKSDEPHSLSENRVDLSVLENLAEYSDPTANPAALKEPERVEPTVVTQEDRRKYFIAWKSRKPFTRVVKLFDGAFVVVMRDLSTPEKLAIIDEVNKDKPGESFLAQTVMQHEYLLARSIVSTVENNGTSAPIVKNWQENFKKDSTKNLLKTLKEDILFKDEITAQLFTCYLEFDKVCAACAKELTNDSFWKGISS